MREGCAAAWGDLDSQWTLDPNGQPTAMVYDAQTRTVLVSEIVSRRRPPS